MGNFADRLARQLGKALADVGFTKPQVVRLGYGDGSGRIVQNPVDRTVYTFTGDIGDNQREIGTAILSQSAGILLQDSKTLEGLYVEIAIPPGKSQPHVTGMAGSTGLQAAGGKTQLEQILARAALPDLSKIATLRARPVAGANEITVDGVFVYVQPSTGLYQSFDGGTISLQSGIDALAIGEHQLTAVCLNPETGTLVTVSNAAATAAGTLPSRAEFSIGDVLGLDYLGYLPIIACYTYSGQTSISESDLYRQYDPRPLFRPAALNNFTATTAPGVGDDSADGYTVGSQWLDLTADKSYICLDSTAGAAVWKETSNAAGGAGTVTSVALAAPSILTVSGSPVTTAGTLTMTLATQSANAVLAGPTSGGAATPTFRALVADDIPNLSAAKITSGTLALARGGTGADLSATGGANQFVKQSSAGGAFTVAGILSADLTTALTTPPPIGGTTPSTAVFSTNVQITASAANARLDMYTYGAQNLYQGYAAGGTEASPTATTASQNMLNVTALGYDGSAYVTASPRMIFQAAELFSGSAQGTQIIFSTTRATSTTRTDVLTIGNTGALTSIINDTATAAAVDVWTINTRSTGTAAASFGAGILFNLESSTTNDRNAGRLKVDWQTATDASRAGRLTLDVFYTSTARTVFQAYATSTASQIGFFGATPVAKPTVTGSRGGNAALASALTAFANLGLIVNSSTA